MIPFKHLKEENKYTRNIPQTYPFDKIYLAIDKEIINTRSNKGFKLKKVIG